MANNLQKAMKKVDSLVLKAEKERDSKGYRENLGYDQYHVLCDFLVKLNLPYSEESRVKDYFHRSCDLI